MPLVRAILVLVASVSPAFAQSGGFANLNFDLGIVRSANGQLDRAALLPSWTIGGADVPGMGNVTYFFYDDIALDAWAVSVHDSQSPYPPINGRFSVMIQSGRVPSSVVPVTVYGSAFIAQTATVPGDAKSLLFSVSHMDGGPAQVSMQGQALPYYKLQDHGTYSVYGADISAFAGTRSELKFGTPNSKDVFLDDIQFSTQIIPEPGALWLLSLGLLPIVQRRIQRT